MYIMCSEFTIGFNNKVVTHCTKASSFVGMEKIKDCWVVVRMEGKTLETGIQTTKNKWVHRRVLVTLHFNEWHIHGLTGCEWKCPLKSKWLILLDEQRTSVMSSIMGRSGYPLPNSCLENPMDRGAWQSTVHRVTQNRAQLKPVST